MELVAPIKLSEHKDLFKDENAFQSFVAMFKSALSRGDMQIVFTDGEPLFTAVSPQRTKELLYDRIFKRMADDPKMIGEIADRLENDKIVD